MRKLMSVCVVTVLALATSCRDGGRAPAGTPTGAAPGSSGPAVAPGPAADAAAAALPPSGRPEVVIEIRVQGPALLVRAASKEWTLPPAAAGGDLAPLREALGALPDKSAGVVLDVTGDVPHRTVVAIMDEARAAGYRNIAIDVTR